MTEEEAISTLADPDAVQEQPAQDLPDVLSGELAEPIKAAHAEVNAKRTLWERAKTAVKAAKGDYDKAVDYRDELLQDAMLGQHGLPFAAGGTDAPAVGGPVEDWRGVSVAELGLPVTLSDKLIEANLLTIGAISDYLKPTGTGYCAKLTDIAGIGAAKAEMIEKALEKFWETHPVAAEPQADPVDETPDGAEQAMTEEMEEPEEAPEE